jgi:hypothetical protein
VTHSIAAMLRGQLDPLVARLRGPAIAALAARLTSCAAQPGLASLIVAVPAAVGELQDEHAAALARIAEIESEVHAATTAAEQREALARVIRREVRSARGRRGRPPGPLPRPRPRRAARAHLRRARRDRGPARAGARLHRSRGRAGAGERAAGRLAAASGRAAGLPGRAADVVAALPAAHGRRRGAAAAVRGARPGRPRPLDRAGDDGARARRGGAPVGAGRRARGAVHGRAERGAAPVRGDPFGRPTPAAATSRSASTTRSRPRAPAWCSRASTTSPAGRSAASPWTSAAARAPLRPRCPT